MKRVAGLGLCLAVLVGACDRNAPSGDDSGTLRLQAGVSLPGFARQDPRLRVAHSGVRRLEFASGAGPGLAFDERITTDGDGHYSLESAQGLVSNTLDSGTFEMLYQLREGFFFRYRDFAVRDPRAFVRNWRVIDRAQSVQVAGRTCARFRVERASGVGSAFELSVDPATDLVLASEEYDSNGSLVASMSYQSVDLAPDLSQMAWHGSVNDERRLDRSLPLGEQIHARALEPRLLPQGYVPLEAAVVHDGDVNWLKLTYSDGVQPLFFLHSIDANSSDKVAPVQGQQAALPSLESSSVIVFQIGAATALQGRVDGFDVIAVGKVPQAELLDLVESALP